MHLPYDLPHYTQTQYSSLYIRNYLRPKAPVRGRLGSKTGQAPPGVEIGSEIAQHCTVYDSRAACVTRSLAYTYPSPFRVESSTTKSQSVRISSAAITLRWMIAQASFQSASRYHLPHRIRLDLVLVPLRRKTVLQPIRHVTPLVPGRGCICRSVSCVLYA
jgi:hypothetical protein